MQRLKSSAFLRASLALLTGVAVLGLEAGHSLLHHQTAHHHAIAEGTAHHYGEPGAGATVALSEHQEAGDHPHLTVVATVLSRPAVPDAAVLELAALAPPSAVEKPAQAVLTRSTGPPPDGQVATAPPPSRAPPQV